MRTITYSFAGLATQTIAVADTATATEQTAAIQTALDAVAGHSGGVVALSAGTFTIAPGTRPQDGALKVGSNTEFHGAGLGVTVLKLADGTASVTGIVRTTSGRAVSDGTVTTTHDVYVHDLTIDGNKAGNTGNTDGFYCGPRPGSAQADNTITIDHVEVRNVTRYGFDPHEQTINLTISNSLSHDNGIDGFTLDFCSQVNLINNAAYNNGRHGFNIVTSSSHLTLLGNDAYGNGATGITIQTGDNEIRAWTHDVSISGGHIYNNGLDGISIRQTENATVTGVEAHGNGGNGISMWGVANGNMYGNSISGLPFGFDAQKAAGYVQTFGDGDPVNDRYIASTGVYIDGVLQSPPDISFGASPWNYWITNGPETIVGSDAADAIAADSGNDVVFGGRGDDTLYGNDGNDVLDGGIGRDNLLGGLGDDRLVTTDKGDTLNGGAGSDTADYAQFSSAVFVNLASPTQGAWTQGTSFTDHGETLEAAGTLVLIEAATGTVFADTFLGDAKDNTFDGGAGNDKLVGGAGNDTLIGGAGNDRLNGGSGTDILTGGTGNDLFQFEAAWGADKVLDFEHGRDHLDLRAVYDINGLDNLSITQSGADTQIAFAGQTITLVAIDATTISADDVMFHGPLI